MANLKIIEADYAELELRVLAVVQDNPEAYKKYQSGGLSDMRYNWDVLRASKYPVTSLYSYLDDTNINSALAKILGNSGKSSKQQGK
jgi:hypothetical protein